MAPEGTAPIHDMGPDSPLGSTPSLNRWGGVFIFHSVNVVRKLSRIVLHVNS